MLPASELKGKKMSSVDPFAAPNTNTFPGMPSGGQNAYPDGYYQPVQSLDIGRLITSPFKSPNWAMNLVWMLVCEIGAILIIGRIVGYGYLAEVAESRSGGKSENWPDFVPERFTEYLMRGLWPFLWNIIWSIPMIIIVGVPIAITIVLMDFLTQNGNQISGTIVALVGFSATFGLLVCVMLAMLASMMLSALSNDFMKGADLKWIWSFVAKVGGTSVIGFLLYCLIGVGSSIVGTLLFCVGLFMVAPYMYMVGADLMAQLHDIFVSRGGTPAFLVPELDADIVEAKVVL